MLGSKGELKNLLETALQRWLIAILICLGISIVTAITVFGAEKLPQEFDSVGIQEHLGAQLDLNLSFRDEKGQLVPLRSVVDGRRPVILSLAYYGCPNLCGLFLNGMLEGLKQLKWVPGKDFQVLTISIDPTETPELAVQKKESYIESYGVKEAARGWHFWVNDKKASHDDLTVNAKRLAASVGFGYRYDKEQDQYAHAAAMMILTPDGKVSRYLYGIDFPAKDLRLALVEASGNKIGNVTDKILLFCFHYDPKAKKYSIYATNLMRAGGGFTVLIVGTILGRFWRRNRKRKREDT